MARRCITVSDFSDFCFGVKRAIKIAEKTLISGKKPVYSLGAIIHNKEVVRGLEKKGLKVLKNGIGNRRRGTIVVCSHGIHPDALKKVKGLLVVIDATCPFVKKAQKIANKLFLNGYQVIIIGDKGHPEVSSLKKFAGKKAAVISNVEEAARFRSKAANMGIIAQTTQSKKDFDLIVSELKKRFKKAEVFGTICHDANMRQRFTEEMARRNKLMVVVGGRDSANTKRLYKICRNAGAISYHIETKSEIRSDWFKSVNSVGVVSGASTPRWIVDEVVQKLRNMR